MGNIQEQECGCSELSGRLYVLESQMRVVVKRNSRVELHKAWETSATRQLAVGFTTYVTMLLLLSVLGATDPVRDACIPTAGFMLSTLSLPFVRRLWERSIHGKLEVGRGQREK